MRCHGTSSACANHVHNVISHISAAFGELFRCYAGAVFKRFVIYNNLYFECFQALNCDNLVESKFQLCNKTENKVSCLKAMNVYFKKIHNPYLSGSEAEECERFISIKDATNALKGMNINKAPGIDGLTVFFFKGILG